MAVSVRQHPGLSDWSSLYSEACHIWRELWLPPLSLFVLTVLLPNLWGIWIWSQGANDWDKSTCAGATEGVCLSLVHACVQVLICFGVGGWGSTRISIIRGLWGPPLSPWLHFTSLSHHPFFNSASVTPLSLSPSFILYTAARCLSHPALLFTPLTTSAYAHPYHYLLHCRHLAQQLGITSPHPSEVQSFKNSIKI